MSASAAHTTALQVAEDGSLAIPADVVAAWGARPGARVRLALVDVSPPRTRGPLSGAELGGSIRTKRRASLADIERGIRRGATGG